MNILIVEDEPQTAQMLKSIIFKLRPELIVMAICDSIESTVAFLNSNRPDLIFMDIQLADGLSFEIFSYVKIVCPVVFCTAYDQYMLDAFKVNGIDYLLKPVKEEDVENAFGKFDTLKTAFADNNDVIERLRKIVDTKKIYKNTLLVQYRDSFIPIQISDIAVFFVDNEILYAYTFDQQKYAVFKTLSEITDEVNPDVFYRISRQALINRQAVKEIQPYFNRKVSIRVPVSLPETLVVSRLKVSDFMQWMEK